LEIVVMREVIVDPSAKLDAHFRYYILSVGCDTEQCTFCPMTLLNFGEAHFKTAKMQQVLMGSARDGLTTVF
jgi:hypothetical protein